MLRKPVTEQRWYLSAADACSHMFLGNGRPATIERPPDRQPT